MFDSSELDTSTSKYSIRLASAIGVLAFIAFGLSAYLTWVTWQADTVIGCTGNSAVNCDAVLGSYWSKWLGLPVSLFGVMTYATILAFLWPAAKKPFTSAGSCLLALSLLAAGSAVWFVAVQVIFIQSFCLYCMGIHTCGLTISVLTIFLLRRPPTEIDYEQMGALLGVRATEETTPQVDDGAWDGFHPWIATSVSCAGIALLMGGQLLFSPPTLLFEVTDDESTLFEEQEAEAFSFTQSENTTNHEETTSSELPRDPVFRSMTRLIRVDGLQDAIDIRKYPVFGNPDAPLIFVEMLDYTCTHCRHLHPYIHAAVKRYGDQIAFAIYHVPLDSKCNPNMEQTHPTKRNACLYARLAMGVSKIAPDRFIEFHNWMMDSEKPPLAGDARRKAMTLAGEEVLLDTVLRQNVAQKIIEHCNVFAKAKSGLPMLLTKKGIISGLPENEQEWFKVLEKNFGLVPVEETPSQ